jgi:hypothetical protein
MSFHFLIHVKKPDAIFHVRLYSIPHGTPVSLEAHKNILESASMKPVELHKDTIISAGIGPLGESYEDEFFKGIPEFETVGMQLAAIPQLGVVMDFIREDTQDNQIWCEITIEQITDKPVEIEPMIMFQPRNRRMYFWGQALFEEGKGHLKFQEFSKLTKQVKSNFIHNQSYVDHYGHIDLTFVHWFKVMCEAKPDAALDSVFATYSGFPNAKARLSELFYAVIKRLTPTALFQLCDNRGENGDFSDDTASGISQGNIFLPHGYTDTLGAKTNQFFKIGFRVTDGSGNRAPLMNHDGDENGDYSLYNFDTIGELFIALCDEKILKPQVEIPILDEIEQSVTYRKDGGPFPNSATNRRSHWLRCSRWLIINPFGKMLFFDEDHPETEVFSGPKRPLYVRPFTDKVDYSPKIARFGKVTAIQPNNTEKSGIRAVVGGDGSFEIGSSRSGRKDINLETIFGFIAQDDVVASGDADDVDLGPELWIENDLNVWHYARRVTFTFIEGGDFTGDQYAMLLCFHTAMLWTYGSTVIEFDSQGIGLEPFPNGIESYDIYDFGEFPMYRYLLSNPGILIGGKNAGEFLLFSIKRTPGEKCEGETHHRLAMIAAVNDTSPLIAPPPDDPLDDPTIDPPPEITGGEPICGVKDLTFAVAGNGNCIDRTEIYLDEILRVTGEGMEADPHGTSIVTETITINFCDYLPGPHVFKMKVYTCDGRVIEDMWLFDVNDDCCGGTGGPPELPHGMILVGGSDDVAAPVAMSGHATIDDAGAVTIDDTVFARKTYADSTALAAAALALSDAEDYTDAAVAGKLGTALISGSIFVGNGANTAAAVAMSGDITIDNAGVSTIGNNKVTTAKILDANVTTAKIADANVTTAKIAASAVTSTELATNAVTTAKITDANVTTAKIADSNVTLAKVANIANNRILGNISGSSAAPSELTAANVKTMLGGYLIGYTQTTVDFQTSNGHTVIDDNVVDTLITDTTKPAVPQYTKVLSSGDFPTNANVADWCVVLTIGGKNTDAINSRTINWRFTLNGTDIGSADNSRAITGGQFWYSAGLFIATGVVAGDTIGVKMWSSLTNTNDYRVVSIYIVPRTYIAQTGCFASFGYKTVTTMRSASVVGAIAGVSYSAAGSFSHTIGDKVLGVIFGAMTNNTIVTFGGAHCIYAHSALTSDNNFSQGQNSSAVLGGVVGSTMPRYLYNYGLTAT